MRSIGMDTPFGLEMRTIRKYDIYTGVASTTITLPSGFFFVSLAMVGEPRAAAMTTSIPLLTPFAVVLLALSLAAVALLRLQASGT
jgi:hypothetical protein